MQAKSILASKTVWLNVVSLAIGIIALLQSQPQFDHIAPYLVLANGIGNLILRIFFTSQPIAQ